MVRAGQDRPDRDRVSQDPGGLDTWLTGVVAICAATLLFSGVLLTGVGAAAYATDPTSAPAQQGTGVAVPEADATSSPPATDEPPTRSRHATRGHTDSQPSRAADPRPSGPASPRSAPRTEGRSPDQTNGAEAAGRGPDPGSSPQLALPVTVPTSPDDPDGGGLAVENADTRNDLGPFAYLTEPAVGEQLFIAGLVGLLFSIGGLVTIAFRRRTW